MTNLKDLLNDFAEDIKKFDEKTDVYWEFFKEDEIKELLEIIKDRLIGE